MESIKIFFISVIQGLTELLPVSSSGHILLVSKFLNVAQSSSFLSFFHIGTTLAILLFFSKRIFVNLFSKKRFFFLLKILLSSVPAAFVGLLFDDFISSRLREDWVIAVSLIVWGVVMIIIEFLFPSKMGSRRECDIENVTWKQSLFMGFAQSFALIPGTSRSGITTIAGIVVGVDKYVALEYSFLLGLPILLGSFGWDLLKGVLGKQELFADTSVANYLMIVVVTFVVGLLSLNLLKNCKKSRWLLVFGIYRILLGCTILVLPLFSR